jgi:hypothetical protein
MPQREQDAVRKGGFLFLSTWRARNNSYDDK